MRWRRRVTVVLVGAAVSGCGVTGDKAGGKDSLEPVEPRAVPRTANEDDDATVFEAVRAGDADLGVVSKMVPPYGLESVAGQKQAFRDGFVEVRSSGLHGIGALPGSLIRPAGVTRRLLGPESYRGVQVAMPPAADANMILAALDATHVPHNLRGEEEFAADAIAAPLTDIASNVYDGVVTTVTANVALGYQFLAVFAGSTEQRDLLVAAAGAARRSYFALRHAEDAAAVNTLCRRGRVDLITAGPEDLAAMRRALAPLPTAVATSADEAPDVLSCADVPGDTASTLVDGVYEVTNGGRTHRITLARGRFDDSGRRGSYSVHGDVLVLNYPSPTGTIAYRWTRDDPELILFPVHGRNSPPTLPWRRVGDAPVAAQTAADGVYELTTAAGDFRWTLDRRQLHQSRDNGAIWARASYTVTGAVLTVTYAETGGEPLTSAPVRQGETVRYRWSLYRGWLRLSPIGDAPTIFAGLWRRIGDAP